ncbi:glycogenin [Cunninghamella echinulata]|nr:glycogenin [Cunninghamella echinulata]
MSKKEAYVTLVATDSYASGALVLAHRLLDLGTQKELVCLVTKNISKIVLEHLGQLYQLIPVDTLYSNDLDNLQLLGRPDLNITFTKIHVWKLTQYKKVVFLDADTLPLKNVDELFERPNFSAAHDCGWPDTFNSGVFVTEPSESDYQALKKMAIENGSFDGGDQGLLNKYFSSWSASSSDHRLPFTYNMTPTSQYTYAPALQYYSNNIAICHFIGLNKPWKYQRYSDGSVFSHQWKGYTDLLQSWWNTWNLHYGQVKLKLS